MSQVHSLQELRRSASLATKVFVQRDYSDGTTCQFQTKFPPELESRIERQLFEETVKTLNVFCAEAEKIGGSSYLEGCLACATAYFIFLCMETHYEKVLRSRGGLGDRHGLGDPPLPGLGRGVPVTEEGTGEAHTSQAKPAGTWYSIEATEQATTQEVPAWQGQRWGAGCL
nr:PREDICTED: golgin subfamily A member 7B-like [Opisthocomus hoazin]